MRTLIADLEAKSGTGQTVTVCGWAHRIRDLGKVCFVLLRDRSGLVQLVLDTKPEFSTESVLRATGSVAANAKAPGGLEIQVRELEILSAAAPDLPLPVNQDPGKLSLEALLDNRIISLRNPKILAIFRLQSAILKFFAAHLRGEGFTEVKTSKLIGTGTEGGTGLFAVDYFDTRVYLAQSPQFYKQAMISSGLERVFEIGAAYRAEKHETPRHLNEYVSLDVEMAFIDSEQELMDLEVRILKSIFAGIEAENGAELEVWGAGVPGPEALERIPRLSHEEAKEIVGSRGGRKVYEINPEGERLLCEWAREEHGIDAVFVYAFPRKKRPFYTYPHENRYTRSFDLLFRGLEITTGGQRINDHAMLLDSLERFGLEADSLRDYLDIFKYGCPPHGGFAIGLERLTQKILNLDNVKEASLFPRDRRRVRP
jgi:nondiscriminating aspartyl-tRNA synthetase